MTSCEHNFLGASMCEHCGADDVDILKARLAEVERERDEARAETKTVAEHQDARTLQVKRALLEVRAALEWYTDGHRHESDCNALGVDDGALAAEALGLLDTALAQSADAPEKKKRDGAGFYECEFCGCRTNAYLRRCCDAGHAADAPETSARGADACILDPGERSDDEREPWNVAPETSGGDDEFCKHNGSVMDSMPPICGLCGAIDPWSAKK